MALGDEAFSGGFRNSRASASLALMCGLFMRFGLPMNTRTNDIMCSSFSPANYTGPASYISRTNTFNAVSCKYEHMKPKLNTHY